MTTIIPTGRRLAKKALVLLTLVPTFTALSVSCSNDVSGIDSSATQQQLVTFTLFSSEITPLSRASATSRADDNTTSGQTASSLFKYLDVAFFDAQKGTLVKEINQTSASEDETFGTFKVVLPYGSYQMVAIANSGTAKATITSSTNVSFENDKVVYTQYNASNLTVDNTSNAITSELAWGSACFKLTNTDDKEISTPNVKKIKITITGNCGNQFNPQTGFCTENTGVTREFTAKNFNRIANISVSAFLGSAEEKVAVTCVFYGDDNTTLRTLEFKDVVLKKGYITIYSGPFLTKTSSGTITFASTTMPSSGNDKTFD